MPPHAISETNSVMRPLVKFLWQDYIESKSSIDSSYYTREIHPTVVSIEYPSSASEITWPLCSLGSERQHSYKREKHHTAKDHHRTPENPPSALVSGKGSK